MEIKQEKVLAYFKPFNAVVIRSQDHLTHLTFKEAFPKEDFTKQISLNQCLDNLPLCIHLTMMWWTFNLGGDWNNLNRKWL